MLTLLLGVLHFHHQAFQHLPLPCRPVPGVAQHGGQRGGFGQPRVAGQTDAVVAQIGAEPVAHLRGAFDRFAVSVEPVAPFLGLGIGHPDDLGGAGQVGFADAHGTDLVVVGVRLLELAQMAALQHPRLAPDGRQRADDLEAVARSLQQHEVLGGGVLLGPGSEASHRHLVEDFLHHRAGRGGPAQDGSGETIGMSVQPDHP